MLKYWRVIQRFWLTSIAADLEYRLNFFLSSLSSLASLSGSIFGLSLFYQNNYTFPGWSWPAALLVMGLFSLFQGVAATFLTPNLNRIVTYIQDGTLDFVLLKPIGSQFWLSARTVSPWGFADILFGLLTILYGGSQLQLSWINYLWGVPSIFFGTIILYSLWFILGTMSIWFVKIYNVTEVLRGLLEAGRYPMIAYPAAYRFFFTFVVPVSFLTTVPAEAILGKASFSSIGISAAIAFFLLAFSHWFWRFALRFYTSASS
jgi:ABC-2 type transport system permease protein